MTSHWNKGPFGPYHQKKLPEYILYGRLYTSYWTQEKSREYAGVLRQTSLYYLKNNKTGSVTIKCRIGPDDVYFPEPFYITKIIGSEMAQMDNRQIFELFYTVVVTICHGCPIEFMMWLDTATQQDYDLIKVTLAMENM
jgi:hypothetical protein